MQISSHNITLHHTYHNHKAKSFSEFPLAAMVWMLYLPQHSCVEIMTPKGEGISRRGHWKVRLGHGDRAIMSGISAFIKEIL